MTSETLNFALESGSSAPLGTTAKSSDNLSDKFFSIQKKRFELQRVASRVLAKDALKKLKKTHNKFVGDEHRVCDCCWTAIASHVFVGKSVAHGTGHYKNLATCGSVWSCPVCAAKIQERRRQEIASAMNLHYAASGKCVMLTLTAPHYANQSLCALRVMQSEALKLFRKSVVRRYLKQVGSLGLIRSLECTYSKSNGWHLHTHELYFVDESFCAEQFKALVLREWFKACKRAGFISDDSKSSVLLGFHKHSVDVKDNASCSDYLAKQDDASNWGVDREIAKSTSKKGKASGLHPFGLLAAIADNDSDSVHYEKKFVEYCNAMKGARQLFWSPKLKGFFGIVDKSDDECAVEEVDSLVLVAEIPKELWVKIRAHSRAVLLEVVAKCTPRDVDAFIASFIDSS